VGDDLELKCEVEGDPHSQIRWNKMHNGDFQDNVQIFGNVLKIRDIRDDNGGVYRCIASTTDGIIEEDYALAIQGTYMILTKTDSVKILYFYFQLIQIEYKTRHQLKLDLSHTEAQVG
jgi:hypothetical protein